MKALTEMFKLSMRDHRDKNLWILILFCLNLNAQEDTVFIKKNFHKINDSLSYESITIFNPEIGLNILFEKNRYFTNENLTEENTKYKGKLNGEVKKYYSNGRVREVSNYVLGSKVGLYIEYYNNSKLKSIGEYALVFNDSIVYLAKPKIKNEKTKTKDGSNPVITTTEYNQGFKNGKWFYFNEKGVVIREEYWSNGKLIEKKK